MEKTSEPFCAEDKETEKKMEHSGRQGKMGEVFDKKRDFFYKPRRDVYSSW